MILVKGDQVPITIILKSNDQPITSSQIVDLRVKINNTVYNYPERINYDSSSKKWIIYVSQKELLDFGEILDVCVQANFGGSPALIRTTPVRRITVKNSNFDEIWR